MSILHARQQVQNYCTAGAAAEHITLLPDNTAILYSNIMLKHSVLCFINTSCRLKFQRKILCLFHVTIMQLYTLYKVSRTKFAFLPQIVNIIYWI